MRLDGYQGAYRTCKEIEKKIRKIKGIEKKKREKNPPNIIAIISIMILHHCGGVSVAEYPRAGK